MKTVWPSQANGEILALELEIASILNRHFGPRSLQTPERLAMLRAREMEYIRLFWTVRGSRPAILPTKHRAAFLKRVKERAAA